MIPPIPVHLYATVAAAQQMNSRRAKGLDGDSSSEDAVETFNAVNPSMSSQAESGARQVANRFKPANQQKSAEEIEDEEEKLLRLIAEKFGIEKPAGFSLAQAAAYLKAHLFSPANNFDIAAIEKEFGLDIVDVTLADFLDAMIDPESEAAKRVSLSFDAFLQRQDVADQRALLDYPDATDEELGLYSPFKT